MNPLFLLTILAARANLLYSDGLNYPNGLIEGKGLWFCYTPASPYLDAYVTNHLLILNPANHDGVAAPTNGVVNPPGFPSTGGSPSPMYASFTINVSQLPSLNGGYFCEFLDASTTNAAARIFIDSRGTAVPGTYRLGVANYNTSITATGSTNFPVDLAPGVTYQVVMSWDENPNTAQGATLWINPSSESDQNVYPGDSTNSTYLQTMPVASIAFSQYGAYSSIGNVMIGTQFSDVMTNAAQLPVFGIQPQGATNYAGYNLTLYGVASGMDVTYQWLSNNVPLTDDDATVVGSQSNILNLTNLQNSANYSVVATDNAGSVTSVVAVVSINTTPTAPFFTLQPQSQTNSLGGTISLTASASGTGPITYQWYFAPTNSGSYSLMSGQTGSTLTLSSLNFGMSGTYYVTATGISSQNSSVATVLVIPPPTVSLAYLHSFLTLTPPNSTNLNNGTIYNVQGVVASFGAVLSKTYSEYFLQDGTAGAVVFINGTGATNVPPAGTLVTLTGMAQQYYGQLELVPNVTVSSNQVISISPNNPVNTFALASVPSIAGTMGATGLALQGAEVTLTNVYLYSSSSGAAVSGTFPVNSSKTLYAFQQPYSASKPYVAIYVTTYTNAANQLNTNYFGKPIPSFCYQLTGGLDYYNTTTPEVDPSRYADFVTSAPAAYTAKLGLTNGIPTVTWPAATGSSYSVYSATNLPGPWKLEVFGTGYYPSVGAFTDTSRATAKFYRISTP